MIKRLILAATVVAAVLPGVGAMATGSCDGNTGSHAHSASGSCKSADHSLDCATSPVTVNGIRLYVTPTADGAEVEACGDSDTGSNNAQGRVVVRASTSEQGVRATLDSDNDQPFDAGWITVQASGKSGNATGVYCTRDPNEAGTKEGDGYKQPWSNPGPDSGMPECVPNLPI